MISYGRVVKMKDWESSLRIIWLTVVRLRRSVVSVLGNIDKLLGGSLRIIRKFDTKITVKHFFYTHKYVFLMHILYSRLPSSHYFQSRSPFNLSLSGTIIRLSSAIGKHISSITIILAHFKVFIFVIYLGNS